MVSILYAFCHGNETKESRPQPHWLLSYHNVAYFLWLYCKGIRAFMTTTNTTIVASLPVLQGVVVEGGWDGCNFLFFVGMMGHWERVCRRQSL